MLFTLNYEKKIFLTFDIDWACDEVLNDTLEIINLECVKATFFVTHYTKILGKIKENKNIELGIHPNFNSGACINFSKKELNKKINELKKIVPEALSMRTHGLIQSSSILEYEKENELLYDVNTYIPSYSGIELTPFKHFNGITRVPFFWEDDGFCISILNGYEKDWNVDKFLSTKGVKVFNFHPIHVFLNTENLKRYEEAKKYYNDYKNLKRFINQDEIVGTRVFLKKLIHCAQKRGFEFMNINEITL